MSKNLSDQLGAAEFVPTSRTTEVDIEEMFDGEAAEIRAAIKRIPEITELKFTAVGPEEFALAVQAGDSQVVGRTTRTEMVQALRGVLDDGKDPVVQELRGIREQISSVADMLLKHLETSATERRSGE